MGPVVVFLENDELEEMLRGRYQKERELLVVVYLWVHWEIRAGEMSTFECSYLTWDFVLRCTAEFFYHRVLLGNVAKEDPEVLYRFVGDIIRLECL